MIAYITELNTENFEDFTKNELTLVDIWAPWCGPCKMISPLVDEISKIIGFDIEIKDDSQRQRPDKSEVSRLFCDNKKLLNMTQWTPKFNLNKGLVETIEWFKNNLKYYKHEIYNK